MHHTGTKRYWKIPTENTVALAVGDSPSTGSRTVGRAWDVHHFLAYLHN